ncbi:MAG TPA: PhoH family protein [Alphaproteobacteria bacterium]|nr:PhoH family protein [Alphaproteobacteria bacterium]
MAAHSIEISFDDNRRLPLLYGGHNANLARIERQLGVKLTTRGNIVSISGPAQAAETARSVLDELWRRTSADEPVGPAEIDAALRLKPAKGKANHDTDDAAVPVIRTRRKTIAARTKTQAVYMRAMNACELVIGTGPAGTGKTYLAVCQAVAALQNGHVDRIVISRPAIEAGERLGFLPGDLREKIDPYLRPIYDALNDLLSPEQVEKRIETGEIEIAPLAFMRGRTLAHCFVILDEAQNTTTVQMKMALTRLGEGSRMVVTGDPGQIDLPYGVRSGLIDAMEILNGVQGTEIVQFNDGDVVRLPLVARIIRAYAERAAARAGEKP